MLRKPSRWLLYTGVCLSGTFATSTVMADEVPLLEPVPAVAADASDSATPSAEKTVKTDTLKTDDANHLTPVNEKSDVETVRERFPNGKVKIEREVIRDAEDNYVNHGQWKMWDAQGNVVGEGRYVNGQRQGTWTAWFFANESPLLAEMPYKEYEGPFTSEASFENGKLTGTWTIYDSKKRKISEWNYADGQRHGLWTSWYANGRKMRQVSYEHGELSGDVAEWSPDGVQVTKDVYEQGRKIARKVEYYSNKQKKSEGVFLFAQQHLQADDDWWEAKLAKFTVLGKDERHGEWTAWHSNGQVQMQGRYDHDAPVGEFTWWFPNGQKSIQGSFTSGQRHGEWTWYHENGQKSTHGDFVMGGPNGRWIWWSETGKVAQKVEYAPGKGDAVKSVVKQGDGKTDAEGKPEAADSTLSPSQENLDPVPQAASAPESPVKR